MNRLYKIRWTDDETGEAGTSIFLAKSENHAKATFYRFNPNRAGAKGLFQVIDLKSDGIYDIHMLNQLHEGDTFRLAHKSKPTDAGPFWNDEYETGTILYTKGPYDPTRHQYQVIDEFGFVYYVKPYETVVPSWEV